MFKCYNGYMKKQKQPAEEGKSKKKISGIIVLIIGALTLIGGLVFMLVNLFAEPGLRDAEYLVEIGTWAKEDEPGVVWHFTEVGKGTLTTNDHTNDYDFIWAIDGDKLEIETEWLYTLNDEYTYELNQQENKLILNDSITFVPVSE